MKILFAASEAAPFAKTGGLADVAGSLPPALASLGHEVSLVMPRYRAVDIGRFKLERVGGFTVPLGTWHERCDVFRGRTAGGVTVYFINKDNYYDRPGLYRSERADYPDNAERFIFFSRAVVELAGALDLRPDIVHCNDWQTGLVPLYLKQGPGVPESLRRTRTVFTVHNLGYQGLFWHWDMRLTGLGWDVFTPEGIEFWGKINLLKAGLVYADILTTVSRTYSREIQTPEFGCGLEGVLKKRAADLYGIVNGIDTAEWNPGRDSLLPQTYSAQRLAGKAVCKKALLKRLKLPDKGAPLIGMVTRLVDQKGIDILVEALDEIMSLGVQLVILGTGDVKYHQVLGEAAGRYPGLRVVLEYNDTVARNIYAGSDLFLMPSRYEPCGLGQLHALRYGSVPVVRKTGGLADTVVNYSDKTGHGRGFVFRDYSAEALVGALERAVALYRKPRQWKLLIQNGMKEDFSWERSAQEYVSVYRKVMKKR